MLRFDYMPSDFHPVFLFLGSREELIELQQLFRSFSSEPRELDLRTAIADAGGRSQVRLVPSEALDAPYGMHATPGTDSFAWTLNAWQAEQVALRLEALLPEELKSGNDILEFGIEGEIPVKVSRGEFMDIFLTPKHHLHPDYTPE